MAINKEILDNNDIDTQKQKKEVYNYYNNTNTKQYKSQ